MLNIKHKYPWRFLQEQKSASQTVLLFSSRWIQQSHTSGWFGWLLQLIRLSFHPRHLRLLIHHSIISPLSSITRPLNHSSAPHPAFLPPVSTSPSWCQASRAPAAAAANPPLGLITVMGRMRSSESSAAVEECVCSAGDKLCVIASGCKEQRRRANQMQTAAEGELVASPFPRPFGKASEKFCNNSRQNFAAFQWENQI